MYLVVYDISDNKRRTKLHKRLLNYGTPVQLSVFEISHKNLAEVKRICAELLKPDDRVRLYHLCKRCSQSTILYGRSKGVMLEDDMNLDITELPEIIDFAIAAETAKKPNLKAGPLELGQTRAGSRLMEMVCGIENLNEAFLDVRTNRGCAGSDGVSIAAFERNKAENLAALQRELLDGKYRPRPLKIFSIDKPSGDKRILKVPSVRDRVAQQAVLRIINLTWEKELEPSSYAFRKGRSVAQAIKKVEMLRDEGRTWVLRADIDDYFDRISHEVMINRFSELMPDEDLLNLVKLWMNTDNTSTTNTPGKGIPQGSVISPLLPNIYLDRFDEAMDDLGYEMVRYADDVIVACFNEEEAQDALADMQRELLSDGLVLNESKTQVASFDQGFMFLGKVLIKDFVFGAEYAGRLSPRNKEELADDNG